MIPVALGPGIGDETVGTIFFYVGHSPSMILDNHAGVSPDALAAIAEAVADHLTLLDAVRWGFAQSPPRIVAEVIVQDEFTHDVILPFDDALFLVYETT